VILLVILTLVWWIAGSFFANGLPRFLKPPNHDARCFDPYSFFGLLLVVNACVMAVIFCVAVVATLMAILPLVIVYAKTRIGAARINRR
jgi:hypothetical protein